MAGIMRHWNDRYAKCDRQPGSAGLVVRTCARPDARASRVDDDPEALPESLAPLLGDLLHRVLARLAVDGDRRGKGECPAEERNRQQLLLRDKCQRRKQEIERERFPGGRMLGYDDVRPIARRNVLASDDPMADPAEHPRSGEIQRAPTSDE